MASAILTARQGGRREAVGVHQLMEHVGHEALADVVDREEVAQGIEVGLSPLIVLFAEQIVDEPFGPIELLLILDLDEEEPFTRSR